jgi:putative hemolysin
MLFVASNFTCTYIDVEMGNLWIELAAIFALILANGFFAASEYALLSIRKARISSLIDRGDDTARTVRTLKSRPNSFVAAVQVGITLVGTLASVVGGATIVARLDQLFGSADIELIARFSDSIAIALVVASIAFLTLVLGELVPKRIGLQHAERISLSVAKPMVMFMRITFVPVRILTFCSRIVVSLLRLDRGADKSRITEEEIVQMIADGRKEGEFSAEEHRLVESVFEFTEGTVRKAMTPRTDIAAINVNWPVEKAIKYISENGRSRYPAFKDSIDSVVGMIYTKDIIHLMCHSELIVLHDILRTPFFVPDSKSLTEVLADFQRKHLHMAIVLDDFGGTAGIITLEDIIEEIVGEIQDEYDTEEREYKILADGTIVMSARMSVQDFNKLMKMDLPEDQADTIGGFIATYLGEIPVLRQKIEYDDLVFTVVDKKGNSVSRLSVVRVSDRG